MSEPSSISIYNCSPSLLLLPECHLLPDQWQHDQCNVLESSPNRPLTGSRGKLSSMKPVPGAKRLDTMSLAHATRTLSLRTLVRGAVGCSRLFLLSFLILRETVGHPWSVLSTEARGSSKWVCSVGAYDLASGGGLVCLCLWLNFFHGSRKRQKRRGKPTPSQELREAAPCIMFCGTPYGSAGGSQVQLTSMFTGDKSGHSASDPYYLLLVLSPHSSLHKYL